MRLSHTFARERIAPLYIPLRELRFLAHSAFLCNREFQQNFLLHKIMGFEKKPILSLFPNPIIYVYDELLRSINHHAGFHHAIIKRHNKTSCIRFNNLSCIVKTVVTGSGLDRFFRLIRSNGNLHNVNHLAVLTINFHVCTLIVC